MAPSPLQEAAAQGAAAPAPLPDPRGFTAGLDRVVGLLSRVFAIVGATAAAVIAIVMVVDVVERLTADRSIPGAYEFVQTMLVVTIFMSLPYGERARTHVRVELVTQSVPARVATVMRLTGNVVAFGVAAWLAFAAWNSAVRSVSNQEHTAGIVQFPIYPAKICIFLGLTLLAVELLMTCLRHVHELRALRDLGSDREPTSPAAGVDDTVATREGPHDQTREGDPASTVPERSAP